MSSITPSLFRLTRSAALLALFTLPLLGSNCDDDSKVDDTTPELVDADGDGYFDNEDCDDNDAEVYPGEDRSMTQGENQDCDCVTELLRAPEGAMAPEATEVELSILRGRGLVHVTLAPAVDNRHTTVISINDSAYEGPGWYEIELGYPEE